MNDLLNLSIRAHGGLERWRQVRNLQAKVTLNGTLWRIKGRPNGLPGVLMRADTRQPALTMTPFPSPGNFGQLTRQHSFKIQGNRAAGVAGSKSCRQLKLMGSALIRYGN